MKIKFQIFAICFGLSLSVVTAAPAFADTPRSTAATSGDTLRNVWVFFKDKDDGQSVRPVSARSALRRRKAGFRESESERPVNIKYIREIERRGGALRTVFPWGNAASFSVNPSRVSELSSLPFVKAVSPVGVYVNKKVDDGAGVLLKSKSESAIAAASGGYDWHTEMVNVPLAHDYLRYKGLGVPGSGVVMAFFDGGFRLDHAVYKRLLDESRVIAAYDFVDGDAQVADPDWMANLAPNQPYYRNDQHGSQTLSFAAAYLPGVYMGTAFGAAFALARTEDDGVEARVEEDNWAAAMVWADSVGADIISSSLGYRDGFTKPAEDYGYQDMNGATAVVSLAAAEAIRRGMIVVNSMGNESFPPDYIVGTLVAPADVDGVVSVGALDRNGNLAYFSSTGPAYDGRLKPEVVAPGYQVPAPAPYSADRASYTLVSGTSFSAPITAAIVALIRQARPDISPEAVRERLYASCGFAAGQNAVDNMFGYGIPNAALAVIGADEIFLKITDVDKIALAGAVAVFDGQTYTADTAGCILIKTQKSAIPAQALLSSADNRIEETVTIAALPFASAVVLDGVPDVVAVKHSVPARSARLKISAVKGMGIKIELPFAANDNTVVAVHSIQGKKVCAHKIQRGLRAISMRLPPATAKGTYMVSIKDGNGKNRSFGMIVFK